MWILGLALAAQLSSAQDGWAFTTWGMTPEAVVAASNGKLQLSEPRDLGFRGGVERVSGTYDAAGFTFAASLLFHGQELSTVRLALTAERDCGNLEYRLTDLYGDAQVDRRPSGWSWTFPERNTEISFLEFRDGFCRVVYRSLRNSSNVGL